MTTADYAHKVLADAGEPLHYKEITKRMQEIGWVTPGRTPWASVAARISDEIKRDGPGSRFVKTAPGRFAAQAMSFLDAAKHVLQRLVPGECLHYREITNQAREAGLIQTKGKTPESTMAAQIGTDIRRREARGESQCFVRYGRGMIGLASEGLPQDITDQIDKHNEQARSELLARARKGSFEEFEELVEQLLIEMGFEDVERTPRNGGIDVRGTLVVGDVVRIRMAVQAKCWKQNVGSPVVLAVRGALRPHEQGLIITTSDFTSGARKEAKHRDKAPVALMNGDQLAALLAEHQVGARRRERVVFTVEPREAGSDRPR